MAVSATMLVWLPTIYLFIVIRGVIGFGFGVFYNIAYVYGMSDKSKGFLQVFFFLVFSGTMDSKD